jgi:hypothetical protein
MPATLCEPLRPLLAPGLLFYAVPLLPGTPWVLKLYLRVLKNKHQAVSQGAGLFGKHSIFSYM